MLVFALWVLGWLACSLVAIAVGSRFLGVSLGPEEVGLIVAIASFWPVSAPFAVIVLIGMGVVRLLDKDSE